MNTEFQIPASIAFPVGKIVSGRWKITSQLGQGGCAVVYQVQDVNDISLRAALKVESNTTEGGVLKIEADVLRKLQDRPYTIRLLQSGKRDDYSFLVITLCGPDLDRIKEQKKLATFSVSTILRIGIHCLYAIKQLHEIGYVHRDVKPSNMVIGAQKQDRRLIYLIDYGMVRPYATQEPNMKWKIKKPRTNVPMRGTIRYCSVNVHNRGEQGRVDDLWSLLYLLTELSGPLPWHKCVREDRLSAMKQNFEDGRCKSLKDLDCLREVTLHLKTCSYGERPNYLLIYTTIMKQIRENGFKFSDPYDWEKDDPDYNCNNHSESSASEVGRQTEKERRTIIDIDERTQDCDLPPKVSDDLQDELTAIERSTLRPLNGTVASEDEALFPTIRRCNFEPRPSDVPSQIFPAHKGSLRKKSRRLRNG